MISSKVTPVEECPMCCEDNIILTNICPNHNTDHKICRFCINNLKHKYGKEFCAYCGECPAIINVPMTVNHSQDSINITIENNNQTFFQILTNKFKISLIMIKGIFCYIVLIYNWHLYRMINHYLEDGEHYDKDVDWHIYNAFYALFLNTCLVFFIVTVFQNNCNKCKS